MSNSSQNPNLPNKVIDLLVNDIFQKNNVNLEKVKGNLSDEQKNMLKDLVQDLTKQVDSFLESSKNNHNSIENNENSIETHKKIRFKK